MRTDFEKVRSELNSLHNSLLADINILFETLVTVLPNRSIMLAMDNRARNGLETPNVLLQYSRTRPRFGGCG